jgi:Predicted beta-xylosidase
LRNSAAGGKKRLRKALVYILSVGMLLSFMQPTMISAAEDTPTEVVQTDDTPAEAAQTEETLTEDASTEETLTEDTLTAEMQIADMPTADTLQGVFHEDFNDGDSVGWSTYGSDNAGNRGVWQVNPAKQYSINGAPGAKTVADNTYFKDLVYEADLKIGGLNSDGTGFLFRVNNLSDNVADGYTGYYAALTVDKKVTLGRVTGSGNEWKELVAPKPVRWNQGHVKVIAVGNHIQMYLNDMDTPVIDYIDNDGKQITEGGQIGLRTWWGTSTIDNIVVREYSEQQTSAPEFSVASGNYAKLQTVSLTSDTPGATIRYTTDGSQPNSNSPVYSSPITVTAATLIKAYAEKTDEMVSDTVEAFYAISRTESELTDDFEDGNSDGWSTYTGNQNGVWTAANGRYEVQNARGDKAMLDVAPENFIVEANINPYNSGQASGFVFRVSDPGNGADNMSGYFVGISPIGTLEVGKMNSAANNGNGKWTEIAIKTAAVYPNTDNHLKVVGLDSTYYIFLNGKLAYQFTDTEYTAGAIGLRAWNDNNKVSYDDVKVTSLTSKAENFADNFDDGNAQGWKTYGGTWSVTDGKYKVLKGAGFKAVADDTQYSNLTFETDISISNGSSDFNAGVLFRVSEPTVGTDNLKGYYAGINVDGRVSVGKFNNNWTGLAAIPYPISQNKVYKLKVVAEGKNIDVYIDGEIVVSVVDQTYTEGAIGLRTFNVDAVYDNITVTDMGKVTQPTYDWSWVQGAVFVPTNVVNQIEQWRNYDHEINDRELSYAKTYGINFVRVFMHNLLWENDQDNFIANMNDFLALADKYDIKVELVFFDDCWNDFPVWGDQLAPRYGAHNSRWVEGPGDAVKANYAANKAKLKDYVQGVVQEFGNNDAVVLWNVYNEPSNGESGLMDTVTKQIMNDARIWIKQAGSIKPVTSTGGQFSGGPFSDFISYHPYESNYPTYPSQFGPNSGVLADEVMNRLTQTVPGVVENFGKKGMGFVMWELGIGRDNTRFPWGSDVNPLTEEPAVPFHGIVYPDGHPWDVNDIKALVGDAYDTLPIFNVQYFKDNNFSQLVKKSITPRIDFDLGNEKGTGSPDPTVGIGEDNFSVRWNGTIQPSETGDYTIFADSDNIAKVWIDGTEVINKETNTREEVSGVISLTGGEKLAVTVEYVHAAGDASLHVQWSGPNMTKRVMLPVFSEIPVESVSVTPADVSVKVGETTPLIASFEPVNASNQQVTWTSSKPGVAVVSADGVVKGLTTGSATITVTTLDGGKTAAAEVTVTAGTTFTNPIVPVSSSAGSADPSIVFKNGYYYYVKSLKDTSLVVAKAKRLEDIGSAPRVTVYTPPAGTVYSKELWAPELQYINGKWYIYFAADDGNNANHRMYVLEGNSQDPQGSYTFKGKITDSTNKWAIDGTVLQADDQSLYFVWSGWPGDVDGRQNIYIAPMSNPWTISGERVLISTPTESWELNGNPFINEGPEILKKDGKVFIVYSASGSWTDDYTLGMLTNTNGNFLNAASWAKSGPLFSKVSTTFGPGHNSFTQSPDGTEDWIVYHATLKSGASWGNRSVRAQKFTWNPDGTPNFGTPAAYNAPVGQPSGTPAVDRYKYEAEDAALHGNAAVVASENSSGGKVVGKLDTAGSDYVEFTVEVADAGAYSLIVMAENGSADSAVAEHEVTINGQASQSIFYQNFGLNHINPSSVDVHLVKGTNTIRFAKIANAAQLDYIVLDRIVADPANNLPVESLTVDQTAMNIPVGTSATLTSSIKPMMVSDQTVTVQSSNPAVATVTKIGTDSATGSAMFKVTGLVPGTAQIQVVSAANGSIMAESTVKVLPEKQEPNLSLYEVDQFDTTTLNSAWSVFQELKSNWSLTSNNGFMTIRTTATDIYEGNNSLNNVFLRNVPASGDFEIVAKFTAPVTKNHQQAGILVWQNADNFVKLSHVWADGKVLETAYEINAKYQKPGNFVKHPGGETHTVKIKKLGNVYTTYYWDGYEWIQASNPVTANLSNIKVGFFASNIVANDSPIDAKFDYFAIREIAGGVDVSPKTASLQVGETVQLENTGISGTDVTWTSENPSIATVSNTGLVEAKAPGRVVIQAVSSGGDFSSKSVVSVAGGPASGTLLYSEDFTGGNTGDWTTYDGVWSVKDGAYTVSSGAGYKAMLETEQFTDFVLESDVKITSGTEAGLLFRASNPSNGPDALDGYYVGINAAKKSATLGMFTNGKWSEIATKNLPIYVNEWYRIKAVVSENHIQIYINDNPLNTNPYPKFDLAEPSHPSTGMIGLRTFNAAAQFDNVKVSAYEEIINGLTYNNLNQLPGIADPHVMYYENVYYLYGTDTANSPNMQTGIKVYTSTNLVNWTERGYALRNEDSWGSKQFWAPEVIERNGVFYMYYAVEEHLAVATSDSPLGPFKQDVQEPIHPNTKEIDAHIFTDDDGKTYMYFVRFNNNNHILVAEMNDDLKTIKEDTIQFVFAPTQEWENSQKAPVASINEGPFVIKHKGTYYMTYSGNHFQSPDYGVGYATAPTPMGPWTKYEFNPIMKSNELVPGAGHHSLIQSPDGTELFMVYHTHYAIGQTEPRKLGIDRVQFVPQQNGPDTMEVWGPTITPQLMPSKDGIVNAGSITVSGQGGKTTITTKGGTLQLAASVYPDNATNKEVTWSIENGTQFATITAGGLLTAVADGTVTVRAASVSNPSVSNTIVITISGQGDVVDPEVAVESVTISSHGGANGITAKAGTLQLNAAVLPNNATNKAVTWSIESGAQFATITADGLLKAVADGTVTVKAASVSNPSVSSTIVITISGQTEVVPGPTNPPVSPPVTEDPAKVEGNVLTLPAVKPDANGVLTVKVAASDFDKVLQQAVNNTVNIEVQNAGSAKKAVITLTAGQLEAAKQKGVKSINVDLGAATFTVTAGQFTAGLNASAEITLSVSAVDSSSLSAEASAIVGSSPVYDFTLNINGVKVSDFGGETIKVSLNYDLKSNENPNQVVVYYISDSGKLEIIKNAKYNAETGKVEFDAKHFSKYAAVNNAVTFTDLANAVWAQTSIEALAAREIVNGVGNDKFAPNSKVTRAEFITMLMNAFEFTDSGAVSSFSDVKEGTWYYDAVALAQKLEIVKGKTDGSFGINDEITREEMAVMAYRASKLAKVDLNAAGQTQQFADQSDIAAYAAESVSAMQGAGIVNGKGNDRFAPKDHASRAEAAKIIYSLFNLLP